MTDPRLALRPVRPEALSPARLAEIAARLARGYYERDAIRDEIVRRLLAREFGFGR